MHSKRGDFSLNTIIGKGSMVKGNVTSAGFTRVDGGLEGRVRAAGRVIIGQSGRLNSMSNNREQDYAPEGLVQEEQSLHSIALYGTTVTVGGVVAGNVLASERVVILADAIVLGDVITRRIQADEGCIIHGRVKVCRSSEAWEDEARNYEINAE
jgi:cytoskeletal protein CcmA (bactofilin family)